MGIKRPIAITHIQILLYILVGYDINCPPQCVSSKFNRHNTFINFYAFGQVDRNIIERHGVPEVFHRNPINKELYLFTRETVNRKIKI
ncbi:hypothetical protein D3C87_1969800 [compost metagenome]